MQFSMEIEKMYARLLSIDSNSPSSYFLFGPRGTGKTSWLSMHFKDALVFDLLNDETYTTLLANPNRLDSLIPEGFDNWIILDEIQKVPALLDEVHRLIESKKYRFILTGSSARKLRREGVNLLAGRALLKNLYPVTAVEQGADFDLQKSLKTGHLPMALTAENHNEYLASYIATYLREEVLQEGLTRNIALFTRFLETRVFPKVKPLISLEWHRILRVTDTPWRCSSRYWRTYSLQQNCQSSPNAPKEA